METTAQKHNNHSPIRLTTMPRPTRWQHAKRRDRSLDVDVPSLVPHRNALSKGHYCGILEFP